MTDVLDRTTFTSQPARVRLPASSSDHFRCLEFLEDEAGLLDDNRLADWLDVLHPDLTYQMPTRYVVYKGDGDGVAPGMFHFDEDRSTLQVKLGRLIRSDSAWAENPASRTRRFVTNVRVYPGAEDGSFDVTSSILLVRTREGMDFVTARREDTLAPVDGELKLKRRYILCDQTVLRTANLAVIL